MSDLQRVLTKLRAAIPVSGSAAGQCNPSMISIQDILLSIINPCALTPPRTPRPSDRVGRPRQGADEGRGRGPRRDNDRVQHHPVGFRRVDVLIGGDRGELREPARRAVLGGQFPIFYAIRAGGSGGSAVFEVRLYVEQ